MTRRFTLEEIRAANKRVHIRLACAFFDRKKTPALIHMLVEELESLPVPEEFKRKAWANGQRGGYLEGDTLFTEHQMSEWNIPVTLYIHEGHEVEE